MSPTKQEEYDATMDPFDPKRVYVAIQELESHQPDFLRYITVLKKAAYDAARALEDEREMVRRLQAQVERWEKQALAHSPECSCNNCNEGKVG